MKTVDLIFFMNMSVEHYRLGGQPSAVRVCRATSKQMIAFIGRDTMGFDELTKGWLHSFEEFLKRRLSDNTISTYLRMLQTVYNKAVYENQVLFVPQLFKKVFKGRMPSRSRALTRKEFRAVAQVPDEASKRLIRVRDLFLLMFYLRGLPFVDLVYMQRSALQGNRLVYRRHKTGKQMVVQVELPAMKILKHYMNQDTRSLYLLPFLTATGEEEYRQYENTLRHFNDGLKYLGILLGLSIPLTSYCARHTWASFANECEPDKKLISEAMGHSSVQVTEIYFKSHEVEKIGRMNQQVMNYAFSGIIEEYNSTLIY